MTSETNVEQRVKIVKNETFSEVYNTIQSNDWTEASLMKILNEGDYYTRNGDYTQTGLQENAKLMIEKVFWNLGAPDAKQSPTVEEHYVQERWNVTIDICYNNPCDTYEKGSNEILWEGLVALRYATDYSYATGGKNRKECLDIKVNSSLSETCLEYNWAKTSSDFELLLSPTVIIEGYAYVNELRTNYVAKAHHAVSYKSDFKPTLYLKKDVKISSGTGNVNDAYKLKYEIS